MLLMSLDAATAAELLKGVDPKMAQELTAELAYLDAAGYRSSKQSAEITRQFCDSLQTSRRFRFKSILKSITDFRFDKLTAPSGVEGQPVKTRPGWPWYKSTAPDEKAGQIQARTQDSLQKREPFMLIRCSDSQTIASVLGNEHPRAIAVVLSELPAKKSSEVLGLLGGRVRVSAISRMVRCEAVAVEVKTRIAETVCKRLEHITTGGEPTPPKRLRRPEGKALQSWPEQFIRKMAVILRNLGKEFRDWRHGQDGRVFTGCPSTPLGAVSLSNRKPVPPRKE